MKLHHVGGGANAIKASQEAQQAQEAADAAQAHGHHHGQLMRPLRQPPTIRLAPGVPPRRPLPLRPRPRPLAQPDNTDADNSDSDQNGIGGLPDDLRALFHSRQQQAHHPVPRPEDEPDSDGAFGKAGGEGQRDTASTQRNAGKAGNEDTGSPRPKLRPPGREAGAADDDRRLTSRLLQRALPSPGRIAQQLLQTGWPGSAALFDPKAATPATSRELLDALMSLLMAAVGARGANTRGAAEQLPSLTAITLAAVQAHLSRLGATPQAPQAMTLGHVKELLLARSKVECQAGGLSAEALQRIENALLLMPLLALNTGRPRTPGQRQLAQDRLQLMGSA